MDDRHGFTLLETLITTAILASGLTAVALMFSYTSASNANTQQRTTAALLLYSKMEEFRTLPVSDPAWIAGGGLDPLAPVAGYFDRVTSGSTSYLRLWLISAEPPQNITMAVYSERAGLTRRPMELIRSIACKSAEF